MILHDGDRHRLVVLIQRRPEAVSALDRPACGLFKTRVAARLLDAAVRRAAVGLAGEATGHLLAQPGIPPVAGNIGIPPPPAQPSRRGATPTAPAFADSAPARALRTEDPRVWSACVRTSTSRCVPSN